MYEFKTITDILQIEKLQNTWECICSKSDSHIYSTWDWISTWWKYFGSDKELNIITIEKNNDIIGIIPLIKSYYNMIYQFKKLEFIGVPDSDFNDFLIEDKNIDVVPSLIEYIKKRENYDFLVFKDVSEVKLYSKKILEIAEKVQIKFRKTSQCPFMYLPENYEIFYNNIKKSLRKNIRYRKNKLEQEGEVMYVDHNFFSSLEVAMENLFLLHNKRYEDKNEKGYFSNSRKNFHKELAEKLDKKNRLHFGFLLVDNIPVAAEYSFKYRDTVYAYQSGFDPDYNNFGVGRLCELYHIKAAINKKMKIYNWTRGFESYISDWTDQSNYNMEYRIYNSNFKAYLLKTVDNNRVLLGKLIEKIPLISKEDFRQI